MTPRIDPIGPYERGTYPVRRVERDRPPADRESDDDRRQQFEERLQRGLRERRRDAERRTPPDLVPPDQPRHPPSPDDGLPHIDVSV